MSETLTSQQLRSAFCAPIAPVKLTLGYRLRLFAVILGLILLQVLYLALIAVILYLNYEYLLFFAALNISLNLFTIVVLLGPPIAGVIATLFLLKPLVAHPPRPPEPLRLHPESEPVLFEFVGRLCDTLGSPKPSRIYVDLQPNAAAAVHGWRGFFFGDLRLTIGLALAADFDLPQFTGVLAHEFGHFAQRAGLRSYFLIQTIQQWFARVVHERDGWDEWLARRVQSGDWRFRAVCLIATGTVAVSRKYLAVLMKMGTWLSSAFSRHMEFDADRYEAAVVGSAVFEQMSRRLPLLSVGNQLAWSDAQREWPLGRLPADIAALISLRASLLPPNTVAQVNAQAGAALTGRLDSHPSMSDRIASVRQLDTKGVLVLDGPAARLFSDLPRLCCDATRHHYRNLPIVRERPVSYVPAGEIVGNLMAVTQFEQAVQERFRAPADFCAQWVQLSSLATKERAPVAAPQRSAPDTGKYEDAVRKCHGNFAALLLIRAGVKINPPTFSLTSADLAQAEEAAKNSQEELRRTGEELREAAKPDVEQLEATLAGLLSGGFRVAAPQGFPVPDPRTAWHCYLALSSWQPLLAEIRKFAFTVQIVRQNGRSIRAATSANLIEQLEKQALALMAKMVDPNSGAPVSVVFDSGQAATIGGQLGSLPGSGTDRITNFLARAGTLSSRALGQLAWIARNGEALPSVAGAVGTDTAGTTPS
jgi:Zn-dependent protease with chaperone function